jgi:hypothetical protein
MSQSKWERFEGPIRGLRLPLNAWDALRGESITTIGQLRAVAGQPPRGGPGLMLVHDRLEALGFGGPGSALVFAGS